MGRKRRPRLDQIQYKKIIQHLVTRAHAEDTEQKQLRRWVTMAKRLQVAVNARDIPVMLVIHHFFETLLTIHELWAAHEDAPVHDIESLASHWQDVDGTKSPILPATVRRLLKRQGLIFDDLLNCEARPAKCMQKSPKFVVLHKTIKRELRKRLPPQS